MDIMKKMKKAISLLIVILMVVTMLPVNIAYAGPTAPVNPVINPGVKNMVKMGASYRSKGSYTYINTTDNIPNDSGPVYRNAAGKSWEEGGKWERKWHDGLKVLYPGYTDDASMGFVVDLVGHNMLGAAIKGDLKATNQIRYENYDHDSDYGQPMISFFNIAGQEINTVSGEAKDFDLFNHNSFTADVEKKTAYIIFSAYAKRKGGIANKSLDCNFTELKGVITDDIAPNFVSATNDCNADGSPLQRLGDNEVIKQNTYNNEPNIYITMNEDCTFPKQMHATLYAKDGTEAVTNLIYLGRSHINYDNGNMTYKFKVDAETLQDNSIFNHFTSIRIFDFYAEDTFQNWISIFNIYIEKRIDTKKPTIENTSLPNTFKVSDEFGLSLVKYDMRSSNVTNSTTVVNIPKTTRLGEVHKQYDFNIVNTTKFSGVFNIVITASDMVNETNGNRQCYNNSILTRDLFLISNAEALRFSLKNSDKPLLNISASDVLSGTTSVLTNMFFKSSLNPSNIADDTVIYYKWSGVYDQSILTQTDLSITNDWNQVKFNNGKDETEAIRVPVEIKTDNEVGSYIVPKYKDGGYLYIIPKIKDATVNSAIVRTGSMATDYMGNESYDTDKNGGFFKLSSNPVEGNFVNRGCDCTGQGTGVDSISHYSSYGNHKNDIGFNVTKNNAELDSLKYFISPGIGKNKDLSKLNIYSIPKNDSGEYNIPITSIMNKTGEYTLTAVLYSNKGDVTVKEIPIRIENPIVGTSNILYNQATKELDFTMFYFKNSLVSNALTDIQIEFVSGDVVQFTEKDKEAGDSKISLYAIAQDAIMPKEDWSTTDKAFFRTEFVQDSNDSNYMTASFRASLANMEKAGDAFIKAAGEKRVHLKYTSSNKVEVYNNNITAIKKSNLPPSIRDIGNTNLIGKYMTAADFNTGTDPIISIDIEESLVGLEEVRYAWVESADTSLITNDGSINGAMVDVTKDNKVNISPKNIPSVTGEGLYKPYFLAVYAKNSASKYKESTFGPFYVLNDDIKDKRFKVTVTDEGVSKDHVFIAIDDVLHDVSELDKADKIKLTWGKGEAKVVKLYDISFVKGEGTTNLSYINVPYIDLIDTNGVGGTFTLNSLEIINSKKPMTIKTMLVSGIEQILPEHFVNIKMLGDANNYSGANIKSDSDDIEYSWSNNPYDIPSLWTPSTGVSAELGKDYSPVVKKSLIYNRNYLFLKIRNSIYRTDEIKLQDPNTSEELTDANIRIGKAENGYLGLEDGVQNNVLIRIKVDDKLNLSKINKIECFDLNNASTSGTAISINNVYKITDDEIAGFIPSLVTSGGAINCKVSINGFTAVEVKSNRIGELTPVDLSATRDNRTITLTNISDYSKYSLFQSDGSKYVFNSEGKTKIYENGKYLLVYTDSTNNYIYTNELEVSGITYTSADISNTLTPVETEEKVTSVNIAITMPLGSVITDRYGIISNVIVNKTNNTVVATAVVTNSAIYAFDIKLSDNTMIKDYKIEVNSIVNNYVPESTVGTSANISYSPEGPALTIDDVTASIIDSVEVNTPLNNSTSRSIVFNKNGSYSLAFKDNEAVNKVKVYTATVNWIDKKCPEPVTRKYVWYDFNSNGVVDDGEKGAEISKGYKTKNNVIVEIEFPQINIDDRRVKLSDESGFVITEPTANGFAYKFTYAYNPDESLGDTPVFRKMLVFTDTLGNILNYNLVIDDIDKTALLTQLNYSTTNFTNRDVVVSMSSNKAIQRFDIVKNSEGMNIEKEASPTYVFKENGTKDFNYREIKTDDPLEGKLVANVTWINKNVPLVKTTYDNKITNKEVEISFTVINGVELRENAKLKYGNSFITLINAGEDRKGTFIVTENGNYNFTVINKYGNTGSIIVPINNIDKKAPELNIIGRDNVYVKAGDKYYDKGATALDNRDGNVTAAIKVTSNVNTSIAGKYEVVYTVSDSVGNSSTKTRTVHVLNINSAVAIVQDKVIDLKSTDVHQIALSESRMVYVELVGIDGNYVAKYAKGEGFDNAYFKTNGSYMSKFGTFTAEKGKYTLYIQDQERNTRIITLEFK